MNKKDEEYVEFLIDERISDSVAKFVSIILVFVCGFVSGLLFFVILI